ncbi:MAG TPA: hypothetical protein VMU45_05910 [Candidatus Eisenbacteria bacterium]|nr:hypothetical protein [Candidatus Eisenbacteria bacterium]
MATKKAAKKIAAKKTVPVSFATKIKPLFTATDVAHMKPMGVLLNKYSYMSNPSGGHAHAEAVKSKLASGQMPPGAPWPASKVNLFKKWMSDGYKP